MRDGCHPEGAADRPVDLNRGLQAAWQTIFGAVKLGDQLKGALIWWLRYLESWPCAMATALLGTQLALARKVGVWRRSLARREGA